MSNQKQNKEVMIQKWKELKNWAEMVRIREVIKILKQSEATEKDIMINFLLKESIQEEIILLKQLGDSDKEIISRFESFSEN